jgi:hypothetical protein
MMNKSEIIKLAESIIKLMNDETKEHYPIEVYTILNNISLIIGPEFSLIPKDLRSSLGIAWAETIDEPNTLARAVRTRSTLSILRAAIMLAHGPKNQISETDLYIKSIDNEIKKCEDAGEDAKFDELWKKTNNAIDFITQLTFTGYGQVRGEGFKFSRIGINNGENKK